MPAADPGGGFVGFGQTLLGPGMVVENARTAWLYQSSSVRENAPGSVWQPGSAWTRWGSL